MKCPVIGCTNQRSHDQLLCRGHWFSVPKELRDRIWNLYRSAQGSEAHRAAVFEAINLCNEKADHK